VHDLVLVRVPTPQLAEHEDHEVKGVYPPFTGHSRILQDSVWLDGPWQFSPPLAGAGFVHVLVLVRVPTPQLAEHEDHEVKGVYPPFTGQAWVLQVCVSSSW